MTTIYELLKKDHRTVLRLLDQLVALRQNDPHREKLIFEIRDELIPHARSEESVLYNTLRSIDEARDELGHAYREHMEAETKLRTLQLKDKIDADWKKTARELRKSLRHHIDEEEGHIFKAAQAVLSQKEAVSLGRAFTRLKSQVRKESGMKATLRMVGNLMPPRFVKSFRRAA
jgi:hemerythrin superfamily protein